MVKVLHVDPSIERMVSTSRGQCYADGWGISAGTSKRRRRKRVVDRKVPPTLPEGGVDMESDESDPFGD